MNKIIKIISALFLSIIVGCAPMLVPVIDVSTLTPSIVRKIPLKVAVVIPEDVEAYTFTGPPHTEVGWNMSATIPLGKMLKNEAPDALSYVFASVVAVKGAPYPQDIDAVILPSIKEFQYWHTIISDANPFSRKWSSNAKTSLKFSVLNKSGMLLLEKTVSASNFTQEIFNASTKAFPESTGKAAAESIAVALRDASKVISRSPEIHAYASGKGGHSIASADPLERRVSVSSDVDLLPLLKVKQNKNAYALVLGIENYRQKLPKADFASEDALLVANYLIKVLGYPEENVVTLLNDRAAKSDFEKYFEKWLSNNVEPGGTVFIYYSGHGAPDTKTGSAYLVPYDGDPTFIAETGYSLSRMYAALGKLPAKEVIVALDSCFSGAGGRSVLAKGARPLVMNLQTGPALSKNMTVLSASEGDQISSTYNEKGHGLFTYFLLKGIKNEDVLNPDGALRLDDLYGYLKPRVERIARKQYNNEQTPQLMKGR